MCFYSKLHTTQQGKGVFNTAGKQGGLSINRSKNAECTSSVVQNKQNFYNFEYVLGKLIKIQQIDQIDTIILSILS